MTITYLTGDATAPYEDPDGRPYILAHICNNAGQWGAGFVLAVSARWKLPEQQYRGWARNGSFWDGDYEIPFRLGETQFVEVSDDITVANMVAQNNQVLKIDPRFRALALRSCLKRLRREAIKRNAVVCMPRIGTGIGGADWEREVLPVIELGLSGIQVDVYDLV